MVRLPCRVSQGRKLSLIYKHNRMGILKRLRQVFTCCFAPTPSERENPKASPSTLALMKPVPVAYRFFWPEPSDQGYYLECLHGPDKEWMDEPSCTTPRNPTQSSAAKIGTWRKRTSLQRSEIARQWTLLSSHVRRVAPYPAATTYGPWTRRTPHGRGAAAAHRWTKLYRRATLATVAIHNRSPSPEK